MYSALIERCSALRRSVARLLTSAPALACLPAVCLGAYWLAAESGLIFCAIGFPLLYLLAGGDRHLDRHGQAAVPTGPGLVSRETFERLLETRFATARDSGTCSAVFVVEIDEHEKLAERYGLAATDEIVARIGQRIKAAMRGDDVVCQTGDFRFAVCLSPVRHLDLEVCIQLAGRIQTASEEPLSLDGLSFFATVCVGFCQSNRASGHDHRAWIEAAATALRDARVSGTGAIRAYSEEMRRRSESRAELRDDVITALEKGQIQPWFQPQISTDTGMVSGFEALARWAHPRRGMVPPSEFLPAIEAAGLLERLAEVMMYHSFTALKAWDAAGVHVPQIGVNFAGPELNNPRLLDKIRWELDRFGLTPERLAVEILETVVADAPDDTITRNINGLGAIGCRIDLDDFGTGHASIASIRRFAVSRIKIDRSFVMKSDRDTEQQRMVSAILTMADRLGVETLAEGVETVGEHALLAQLGCNHVQGFGIGKPMPFEQTIDWIKAHNAKLQDAPKILGGKAG
jgi:diguanylate cyclase (GGDEF)-like protein